MKQDTAKKSLLIIKAKPSSLGAAEGFLKNREWKVKSTTNLKEALVYLVQEQPQFVMVSIDHPNKKVRNLPKILNQAFPVCTITFAEEASTASYNLLSACASEYTLYPPVTGPAVERTVNKYYKDLNTKGPTSAPARAAVGLGEDGVISIKGEGAGFSAQNAQNILAQMLGEDAHGAGMGVVPGGSATDPAGMGIVPGHSSSSSSMGMGMIPGTSTSDPGMAAHGIGAGTLHSRHFEKGKGPSWAPIESGSNKNIKRRFPEELAEDPNSTKKDSIILRGTSEALEKSCVKSAFENSQEIVDSTNVACIVIESPRFAGYLITAMGKNKKIDNEFMGKIQTRLFQFLRSNGENVKESETMDLDIRCVPFENWSLQYAEFLRKSIHEGNEVAMAFFPRPDVKTIYGDSPTEEMASIKLEELAGDVAVEFNVYIYLPRNNKYILYTPRGGVFYHIQKERLLSQGIASLHILKGDLKDLDKYRAQNFFNEKILEYEAKENEKQVA